MPDATPRSSSAEYLLKTILPLILGSLLTLGATYLTGRINRASDSLRTLRESYAEFLTATDSLDAAIDNHWEEIDRIVSRYYNGPNFVGRRLSLSDSVALAAAPETGAKLQRRIREVSFRIMLQEPSAKWRGAIEAYMDSTVVYLQHIERAATLLPRRFDYSPALAVELERDETIAQALGNAEARYENFHDNFEDFRRSVISSTRWRD